VTRSRALWLAAGGIVTFLMVVSVVPPSRGRFDRVLVVGLVVYACVLARAGFGVGDRPEAVAPRPPSTGELSSADEQDVRLARLDASLARATESAEQFAKSTRPMLRRLTTERLRTVHGIDVAAEPARARRLMGEELWEIFATPPDELGPPPAPDRLRLLVGRLERL
jgi:hypothetical protein